VTQTKQQVILRKKASGIAVVLLDCPGKLNSLSSEVTAELEQTLCELENDSSVKALVLVSGKPDTFLSGADLREIVKVTKAEAAEEKSRQGQDILNRLAALGKPTVVGINGICLGGGLELALSFDQRIASDCESTLLGLPEVRLGLIPGMGGTQRLPRLIGLQNALEMILSSEPVNVSRALALGLVDEVVKPDELLERCQERALELLQSTAERKRALADRKVAMIQLEEAKWTKVLATAERSMRIKTRGNYPAPLKAIEAIRNGLRNGIELGLKGEAKAFGDLAASDTAKNLIALFFNTEFARQTAAMMSAKMQTNPVSTVAVIGSGAMGTAIAELAAISGYRVLFKQTNRNPQDNPVDRLRALIVRNQQKAKLGEAEIAEILQRVEPVVDERELAAADLIIEAVFESEELKHELFERLESIISADCTLASNTSSLSINKLASRLADSGRFLGMHFFLPVDRMPLVEIISHKGTKREALARAAGVVSRLGKIPTMVNDGSGFLVNRLLCTYIIEAARLAESGVPLNWIDDSAVEFGMAMGPLNVLDEVGLDVAFKVADALHEGCGERFAPPAVIGKTKELGLIGKKTGTGVYSWDESGRRLQFDSRLVSEIGLVVSDQKPPAERQAWIVERLIYPMIDEAARCLADRIVRKPREIDLAMVLGTGFPPFRGGPLKYADSIGIGNLRARLEEIYRQDGSNRQISESIKKMEAEGRRFYSRSTDGDE
jgi:3-hydroxyacyl-CoA dehydrogenase/enoyl-CoA hydratase/3-hydroxybutyryl-CoA epimerase